MRPRILCSGTASVHGPGPPGVRGRRRRGDVLRARKRAGRGFVPEKQGWSCEPDTPRVSLVAPAYRPRGTHVARVKRRPVCNSEFPLCIPRFFSRTRATRTGPRLLRCTAAPTEEVCCAPETRRTRKPCLKNNDNPESLTSPKQTTWIPRYVTWSPLRGSCQPHPPPLVLTTWPPSSSVLDRMHQV